MYIVFRYYVDETDPRSKFDMAKGAVKQAFKSCFKRREEKMKQLIHSTMKDV